MPNWRGAERGKFGVQNREHCIDGRRESDSLSCMITVETTETGMQVTIPKDEVPPARVNSFVDWLRLEAAARRSGLTELEADRLAEEIKADWWSKNKDRFLKPGAQ